MFLGGDYGSFTCHHAYLFGGLALSKECGLGGLLVFLDVYDFGRFSWRDRDGDLVDVIESVFGGDCVDCIQIVLS